MKIDKRAVKLFNIKQEVFIIAFSKLVIFLCSLFFIYNFVTLIFYLLNNKNFTFSFLFLFILKTVCAFLIFYLAHFLDNKYSHIISFKVRTNLRENVFNKVKNLSLNYTEAISTGKLVVLNSSSITSIEFYFNKFIPQMYATLLIVLSSFIIYGSISVYLFFVMLVLYPLIPASIMFIVKKSKKTNKRNFQNFLNLSDVFFDRLKGFLPARIYGKEDNVTSDINTKSKNYRVSTMKLLRHQLNSINVMDAITYLSILCLSLVAIFVKQDIATVIFIICASYECFKPLRLLGGLFHISMKAEVELDTIYSFLDYKEEEKDSSLKLSKHSEIVFDDVSFSYDNKNTVLKNINLIFKPSTKVALVGESGSGKSTLIKLMLGLKKATKGYVKFGENDLGFVSLEECANYITLISSNSYLTKNTIYNTLKISDDITKEDMLSALERVNLKDFVLKNGGLDFMLTEGASNLSGGERQRLLAAKAILKNSYVYILDESLANIDEESKKIVLKAFDSIKENKIIILISHDLDVTSSCDNIYLLKDGEIVDSGDHDKLLLTSDFYKNLYTKQSTLKNFYTAKGAR